MAARRSNQERFRPLALPAAFVRELPGLVADLAFFAQQMELPAFVVLDAEHQYIVMESAPLILEAVQV